MSEKNNLSVLFLGKENDIHCTKALNFCQANFSHVTYSLGKHGDPFPQSFTEWKGDIIISYLSRWIITERVINNASKYAINFHPATPDYPGIGCTNFALYENAEFYGSTCHFMSPSVDTGAVIKVSRFPVLQSDGVQSLLERTYEYQLVLFYDIMFQILGNINLTASGENWSRRAFLRKELNKLMIISPDMDEQEMNARIRATNFGDFKPFIELNGRKFILNC